jgi:hypothetical protein
MVGFSPAPETRGPNPHNLVGNIETQPMATAGAFEDQELMPQAENLSVHHCSSLKGLPS